MTEKEKKTLSDLFEAMGQTGAQFQIGQVIGSQTNNYFYGQQRTDGGQRTTDNRQRTTDNRERTADNRQRTTDNRERTTDNGLRTTENGLRTTDNGLRTTENGQQTTDGGQQTTDYGQQRTDGGLGTRTVEMLLDEMMGEVMGRDGFTPKQVLLPVRAAKEAETLPFVDLNWVNARYGLSLSKQNWSAWVKKRDANYDERELNALVARFLSMKETENKGGGLQSA